MEESEGKLPQKRYYRQRAHCNPYSYHCVFHPLSPETMDWKEFYPGFKPSDTVTMLDIGCGYGGLLIALAPLFPDAFILGIEIRLKVCDYVKDKIQALRYQCPNSYNNIACIRTNAMKYLPYFFKKGQIEKMFFAFPDPHFKHSKHKRRIISEELVTELAYIMRVGGHIYTITDVEDLHKWMHDRLADVPLFRKVTDESKHDEIINLMSDATEEGKKVTRAHGKKYHLIFERVSDPYFKSVENVE